MRILQLNPIPTPFRIEFARRLGAIPGVTRSHVYFTEDLTAERGKHWLSELDPGIAFSGRPINGCGLTYLPLQTLIEREGYDVILSSLSVSSSESRSLLRSLRGSGSRVVLWAEQPMPSSFGRRQIKSLCYRKWIADMDPVGIFAIGDRAACFYSSVAPCPVFVVPYFQELRIGESTAERPTLDSVRFLFSGQLIPRNNIRGIVASGDELRRRAVGEFCISFFGKGVELGFLRTAALTRPWLKILDESPASWSDRLRPLTVSDVLLSPALHSGWGLTIPEALAAGLPVISTPFVESARYFVRDGVNGFLCNPGPKAIADRMEIFLRDRTLTKSMSDSCRNSAILGDANGGASRVVKLLSSLVGKGKSARERSSQRRGAGA